MPRIPFVSRLLCLLAVFVMAAAVPATAQTEKGEKTFGVHAGFVSRNTSGSAGLTFTYAFGNHLRIAPSADVFFRHNDLDALAVAIDMHFPFRVDSKVDFYPLAGLAYTSWGRHDFDNDSMKDVTSHTNGLGLNLGAGLELRASRAFRVRFEARYTLMQHLPTAVVAVGFGYVF